MSAALESRMSSIRFDTIKNISTHCSLHMRCYERPRRTGCIRMLRQGLQLPRGAGAGHSRQAVVSHLMCAHLAALQAARDAVHPEPALWLKRG